MNKKFLAAGVIGILVVGGLTTAGMTYAASNQSNTFLSQVAQKLGISNTELTDTMKQVATDKVNQELKNGTITQQQATAMNQKIANGQFEHFGMKGGFKGLNMSRVNVLGSIATYLGMNQSDLMTAIKNGQKLSDIIISKGKTVADTKAYLVSQENTTLAGDVSNKKITQTQADTIANQFATRVDSVLSGNMPAFRGR